MCGQNIKNDTKTNRVAVFASYQKDGLVHDYVFYYLEGLKKICDDIVFVSDNELSTSDLDKISKYCSHHICKHHGEYDFGSYKRGYNYLKESNLLDNYNELVLCNDSCYGPVFPFEEMFKEMSKRECDFWSITANRQDGMYHLHSYFLVFKKNVFKHHSFDSFINAVKSQKNHSGYCEKYEIPLTDYLNKFGFKEDSFIQYVPSKKVTMYSQPLAFPFSLMKKHRYTLIKIKCLTEAFLLRDLTSEMLAYVKEQNRVLFELIYSDLLSHNNDIYSKEWNKLQAVKCRRISVLKKIFSINDYYRHILVFLFGIEILINKNKLSFFSDLRRLNRNFNHKMRAVKAAVSKFFFDHKNTNTYTKDKIKKIKSVLFLRNDDKIGDMIASTPSFREIKKDIPDVKVYVITGKTCEKIIKDNKNVDEIFIYEKKWLKILKLGLRLRKLKVDLYIDMDKIPTAQATFLLFLIKPIYAFTFNRPDFNAYNIRTNFDFNTHVTQWHKKAFDTIGLNYSSATYELNVPDQNISDAKTFINTLPRDKKNIVINPFAASKRRHISPEQLITLTNSLSVYNFILIGEEKKINKILESVKLPGNVFINKGYYSLYDSMALIKLCDIVISPDTGIVHVACALSKDLVALYKESDKMNQINWGPFGTNYRIVQMPEDFKEYNPEDLTNVVISKINELS